MRRVQLALARVQLGAQLDERFAQRLSLDAPRKNRPFALEASAGNRSAARDLFAGKRDDGVAQSAFAHERDAGGELIDDQDVAHEEVHDAAVLRLRFDQRVRVADHAGGGAQLRRKLASFAIRERIER